MFINIYIQEKILVSPWNEQFETIETSFLPNGYRVYDLDNNNQKWGVAIGEHIILLEEDGRAEVIGGNKGRSKLLLPALNKTNATQ